MILPVLEKHPNGLTLVELNRELPTMPRFVVRDSLSTLAGRGLVEFKPVCDRWRITELGRQLVSPPPPPPPVARSPLRVPAGMRLADAFRRLHVATVEEAAEAARLDPASTSARAQMARRLRDRKMIRFAGRTRGRNPHHLYEWVGPR